MVHIEAKLLTIESTYSLSQVGPFHDTYARLVIPVVGSSAAVIVVGVMDSSVDDEDTLARSGSCI